MNSTIDVAQVCSQYLPYIGGVVSHVKEISERLVQSGLSVEVLSCDVSGKLPKEEEINGVIVRRFSCFAPNKAYYISNQLRKYLKENSNKYKIIHAHGYHSLPAFFAAQNKQANKFVFTPHYHGTGHTKFRNLLHKPYRLFGKFIFSRADKIFCVSKWEQELILSHFDIPVEKMNIIPNGINTKEFQHYDKKEGNLLHFLYVGRLEKYKGVQFLLKILAELNIDFVLDVVGNGPYKSKLVSLTDELLLTSKVRFSDNLSRTELLQKYFNSDIFISFSEHEAFGITVAEALSSGTPCIVNASSGLRQWIDNDTCFGVTLPLNKDEFYSLVLKLKNKKGFSRKIMDWQQVVTEIIKEYEML